MRTVFLLISFFAPSLCYSWGGTGHRIVCEIAYQELTRSTRIEVERLIRLDEEYSTFADACNWADRPKRRVIEHWINVPRRFTDIRTSRCVVAEKCLFSAIREDIGVLKSDDDDQKLLQTLKFLGHWIGDLHQPLHVSYQDDQGGNQVTESGPCSGSLHGIWDNCLVVENFFDEPRSGPRVEDLSRKLIEKYKTQREGWIRSSEEDWADESYQITIAPETDYCDNVNGSCLYDADNNNPTFSHGETKREARVNRGYIEDKKDIVEERLVKAGIRLAYVLNTSL